MRRLAFEVISQLETKSAQSRKSREKERKEEREKEKQGGAELCQAQEKLLLA